MSDKINQWLSQMAALEAELRTAVHSQESRLFFQTRGKRVGFEKSARDAHRKPRTGVLRRLVKDRPQNLITGPLIYGMRATTASWNTARPRPARQSSKNSGWRWARGNERPARAFLKIRLLPASVLNPVLPTFQPPSRTFMDQPIHPFSELFAQLGLPADEASIRQFIAAHSPLRNDLDLADAPFWTDSQAAFLREEKLEDADWAELVDQLNLALRG